MTKEQEAIENIKIYIHDWINESVDEDGYERYKIEEYDKEFINAIETVLSMLEQKDKEIEKKDKIIDLMLKAMDKIQDPQVCKYCDNKINLNHGYCVDAGKCKEGIKQYFENKVKE